MEGVAMYVKLDVTPVISLQTACSGGAAGHGRRPELCNVCNDLQPVSVSFL